MISKKKFLIIGSGAREGAFAKNLCKDSILYAVLDFENPTITDCVTATGGSYLITDSSSPKFVRDFALKHSPDYAFVSADVPLSNGVVDALLEIGIKAVGGTKEATKIEWDKIYSINLLQKVYPSAVPYFKVISTTDEIEPALKIFKEKTLQIVVKPQGLTGGKGVKVMPEHLETYQECHQYAEELLSKNPHEKVLLVEKLEGIEFTVMGITDGQHMVMTPATYDYPFRYENDLGDGTGGMGCFTSSEMRLPFMSEDDLQECQKIMQATIDELRNQKLNFNGVLNGGFFKTKSGIKFMEFNGRFGDPEALNILSLLESPFSKLIENLWNKTLSEKSLKFSTKSSVVKYLVAKEYPMASPESIDFKVDESAINQLDIEVLYASCIKSDEDTYTTLKRSRVVALIALDDSISNGSDRINTAIEKHIKGSLEYRKDIGSKENLKKLELKFS